MSHHLRLTSNHRVTLAIGSVASSCCQWVTCHQQMPRQASMILQEEQHSCIFFIPSMWLVYWTSSGVMGSMAKNRADCLCLQRRMLTVTSLCGQWIEWKQPQRQTAILLRYCPRRKEVHWLCHWTGQRQYVVGNGFLTTSDTSQIFRF